MSTNSLHSVIPTASPLPTLRPLGASAQSIVSNSKEEALEDTILGYRAQVCVNCLTSYTVAIDTSKETEETFETQHTCQAERVQRMQQLTENEKKFGIEYLRLTLPAEMRKAVKEWSRNNVYLVSLKSKLSSIPDLSLPLRLTTMKIIGQSEP
jgi:hypothetical protein